MDLYDNVNNQCFSQFLHYNKFIVNIMRFLYPHFIAHYFVTHPCNTDTITLIKTIHHHVTAICWFSVDNCYKLQYLIILFKISCDLVLFGGVWLLRISTITEQLGWDFEIRLIHCKFGGILLMRNSACKLTQTWKVIFQGIYGHRA